MSCPDHVRKWPHHARVMWLRERYPKFQHIPNENLPEDIFNIEFDMVLRQIKEDEFKEQERKFLVSYQYLSEEVRKHRRELLRIGSLKLFLLYIVAHLKDGDDILKMVSNLKWPRSPDVDDPVLQAANSLMNGPSSIQLMMILDLSRDALIPAKMSETTKNFFKCIKECYYDPVI